jgi:hypothetical protein
MLSHRLIQSSVRLSRPTLNTVLRAQYHSLHEDTASVLPNNVETASASFKVKYYNLLYNVSSILNKIVLGKCRKNAKIS